MLDAMLGHGEAELAAQYAAELVYEAAREIGLQWSAAGDSAEVADMLQMVARRLEMNPEKFVVAAQRAMLDRRQAASDAISEAEDILRG
jgi:hypothetical protein